MMRVSPPDEDREFPGPQASTRVTRTPRRCRYNAVHPPNAPAPITTTWDLRSAKTFSLSARFVLKLCVYWEFVKFKQSGRKSANLDNNMSRFLEFM